MLLIAACLLKVSFENTVTLGEAIAILVGLVILVPPTALQVRKWVGLWWNNHAYTLRMFSDDRLSEIIGLPKPLGEPIDPDVFAPMVRSLTLPTGQHSLFVRVDSNRKRRVMERWFWFEGLERRMLAPGVIDIDGQVHDMDSGNSTHLYDPKPPEVEYGEKHGIGYPNGEDEDKSHSREFVVPFTANAPIEGYLVVCCINSVGARMFGRARLSIRAES